MKTVGRVKSQVPSAIKRYPVGMIGYVDNLRYYGALVHLALCYLIWRFL